MTVLTTQPVGRATSGPSALKKPVRRGWAYAGIGAAVSAITGLVAASAMTAVYDEKLQGDAAAIAEKMSTQITQLAAFHVATMVAVLLLPIFAAGLVRLLQPRLPEGSLLPQVASAGLWLVAVAGLMGTALDTEFIFDMDDRKLLPADAVVFFGHWTGTVPWVWVGAGVAALAVAIAALRYGAAPRWVGWLSLVLGALTTLFGISPLQYMAAMVGPIWLLIASIGFVLAERDDS